MKKYIETHTDLRVRITVIKHTNLYNLRLQGKILFFWVNTDLFVEVKECECETMESSPISPIILKYVMGGTLEIYKKGELDLFKRAHQLSKEYIDKEIERDNLKDTLSNL